MKDFKLLLVLLLSMSSATAYAGGTSISATVTSMTTFTSEGAPPKGYVVVTFSSNVASTALGCASGYPRNLVIDLSSASGAFAASTLITAQMTGQTVTVAGTGSCGVNSSMETLASVQTGGIRS